MGNREVETNQYTKDDAYKSLKNVTNWIKTVDTKIGILMSFVALILGVNSCVVKGLKYLIESQGITLLNFFIGLTIASYLLVAIVTIIMCLIAIFANTNVNKFKEEQGIKVKSLIFYGDINKMSYNDFINKTNVQVEDEIIKDLQTQIYINSYIADKKYKYFNRALISAFIFFIVAIVIIVLVSLI